MLPSTEMHPVACLKPRAVLSKQQAVDIFRIAGVLRPDGTRGTKPTASSVAKRYGVSEKTIRDIWRGRTWYEETLPFDMNRQPKTMTKTGRPLGRKDSAPRKRKLVSTPHKMIQTDSPLHQSESRSSNSEGEEETIKSFGEVASEVKSICFSEFRDEMRNQLGANMQDNDMFQHQVSQLGRYAWDSESSIANQKWQNLEPSCSIPFPSLQLQRMNGNPPQHSPSLSIPAFPQHGNPAPATIQPPPQRLPSLSLLCSDGRASFPANGSQGWGSPRPHHLGLLPPPPSAWVPFAAAAASAGGDCSGPFGHGVRAAAGRPSGTADLLRSLLSMQPWLCR